MNLNVMFAVFKRNFVSYFANPIGYVFICVFVLLSSFAAFWPDAFFNNNLANLDQLNQWFPFIMLIFVPAITMSVWAQERQQGTDELLLTIPGGDLEVVLGKYLAALAIYTVALLFSLVCNFARLVSLGEPDGGLFLGTYAGYWLIGLAMLGIGMVASFLTKNLTIAFIVAALLCAPLVFAVYAEAVLPADLAQSIKHWAIGGQLYDFGRGVIGLSGIAYFGMILVVSLYLSTVLLGRRHWGPDHVRLPKWSVRVLVVIYWGVMLAAIYGVLLLMDSVLEIALGYLRSTPVADAQGLFDFWSLSVLWLAVAGVLLGYALLRRWSWFPLVFAVLIAANTLLVALLLIFSGDFLETVRFYFGLWSFNALWLTAAIFFVRFAYYQGWSWFPQYIPWMALHYAGRVLALLVIAVGINVFFQRYDLHADVSSEGLNSLSKPARKLLAGLNFDHPVHIEAFISPKVPEAYVQTRLNLLTMLRELQARGGNNIEVRINETKRFSPEANLAERTFGIRPRPVRTTERGVQSVDHVFLGVSFSCGLQKVVVPFIGRGTPLEYELVRSVCTLARPPETDDNPSDEASDEEAPKPALRKRIGVVPTDARIYGGRSNWPIIDELKKQYQVQQVKMHKPITRQDYDVLLVVQPSSLTPQDLERLLAALRSGMPAVIFEDPLPVLSAGVPPTSQPRRPPPGMEMYMPGPLPKCDISRLWKELYVEFASDPGRRGGRYDQIVWQDYNPYPRLMEFANNKEFVFVDTAGGGVFNPNDEISSGLQNMLFPFPGFIKKLNALPPTLKIRDLVRTGKTNNGTIRVNDIVDFVNGEWKEHRAYAPRDREYWLAAHIKGDDPHLNVVLVADVDMLSPAFFYVREAGDNAEAGVPLDFDNVTFVLNALDSLADDNRFIQMRKHRPKHRTLTSIEKRTKGDKQQAAKAREKYNKDCDESVKREEDAINERIEEVRNRTDIHPNDKVNMVAEAFQTGMRRLDEKTKQFRRERDRKLDESETELAAEVEAVRNQYKLWAVLLPPILPLVVAAIVFFTRRAREREGIARARRR